MALTFADTHNMITNDVVRLQALIDRKKVLITEDTVPQALHLDDAESIDCLPNEEIFAELARMGYEKPSKKLTFYKAFFSAQWKFLIHTILQCMSAKRTVWNEFRSFMASAVICLATGKGFFGVDTPLFEGMLVPLQAANDVVADVVADADAELTLPSPTPTTRPPSPLQERVENLEQDKIAYALEITKLKQRVRRLEKRNKVKASGGIIALIDADKDVILEEVDAAKNVVVEKNADVQGRQEETQAQVYHIDLEHVDKVLSMQDDEPEPAELKEVIEVVTTTKLMTEVVTAAAITAASTITAALSAARRRKGVVIRDPEETSTPLTIVHFEPKSKDKGKGILVEEPKHLKKQAHIEQDEAYAREGMMYDDIRPIFEKYFNFNVAFLEKSKNELEEEANKALKRKSKSSKQQAVKKQKLDEEVEELKKHLQIVSNDENDVYIEATPLDLKIVQERFASSKPKNFSDDFLLTALKTMFEKPDIEAQVWKNQRGSYGLAKVKSWKFFGVDAVEDIKEYTLKDYYCWLKTYYCWYKLKLLDNVVDSRLRLLKESVAADDKMKK
nr:hypothetical protein [Tanacetum cinerariifolium]